MEHLTGPGGLYFGTFLFCVGSGFIPVLNAEAYLVSATLLSHANGVLLTLAATSGQMVAKSLMYLGGRGVLHLPIGKYEAKLERAGRKMESSRLGTELFLFVSASTGLPPFYATAILAGTLRLSFDLFLIAGFGGRLLRFGAAVYLSHAVQGLVH